MNHQDLNQHTSAWRFQVWASFIIAVGLTLGGIVYLEAENWIKGYLAMGFLFTVGSCFALAKTIRDEHESKRFINRINQAKAEKVLSEYET